jgi:hypothetical protein
MFTWSSRSRWSPDCRRLWLGNLGPVSYPIENALFQWEEGRRALQAIAEPRRRRLADRVVDAIREELRRRIGPTFSAAELADLYGEGTDWAQQVTLDVAPSIEADSQPLADAAFWLYLRGATDFAGGRQLPV